MTIIVLVLKPKFVLPFYLFVILFKINVSIKKKVLFNYSCMLIVRKNKTNFTAISLKLLHHTYEFIIHNILVLYFYQLNLQIL